MEGAANLFVAGFIAAITVMSWSKITLEPEKLKDFPEIAAMQRMVRPLGIAVVLVNIFAGIVVRYI
jgi:hypothetical protein